MYPYITMFGEKLYMTGLGIVIAFLTFLIVSIYLTRIYHQNFWKLFYWMPLLIILCYFFGSYGQFIFDYGVFPANRVEFLTILSPYGYKFHFAGLLLGIFIAIIVFLKNVKRVENKKIRIDILFFSLTLSLVPLGIFLLMGDNFIGTQTQSFLGIKSLHSESQWNKFNLIHPIGIYLSLAALLVVGYIRIIKKKFGMGILGFGILLILIAVILLFQQYPKHGVISFRGMIWDIKQYAALFIALRCFLVYRKWRKHEGSEQG